MANEPGSWIVAHPAPVTLSPPKRGAGRGEGFNNVKPVSFNFP